MAKDERSKTIESIKANFCFEEASRVGKTPEVRGVNSIRNFRRKLRRYSLVRLLRAVLKYLERDGISLGKTLEALAIAGYFKQQGWIKNCLVVCPATLKTQWGQEIEKFTHEDYAIIQSGKGNKAIQGRLDIYNQIREENPFYTIINYELLYQKEILGKEAVGKSKDGKQKSKYIYGEYIDLNQIKDIGYDMIVVDEAQRMKNPQTETASVIRQIMPQHRLLMTGTPISKDLKNIFQPLDYIDPNILTDASVDDFDVRYELFEDQFLVTGFNSFALPARIKEIKEEKNVDILRQKINPFILRRTTEDVSDEMPDKQEIIVTVDWEEKQKKLYEKVQAEMKDAQTKLAEAKDDDERQKWDNHQKLLLQLLLAVCDTPELLTMSDSNVVKRLLGKTKTFPKPQKIERLLEMVEEIVFENGGKLVIFTKFERMTQILAREINDLFSKHAKKHKKKAYKTFLYTGNVKQGCPWRDQLKAEKKDVKQAICNNGCPFYDKCNTRTKAAWHFQNDPDTKVLLGTDAANAGVNLQAGGYLINYDLPDSFDIYDQRNARIRRLGSQHSTVYIYNLVIKGGVDEAKYRKLMKQKDMIDEVVENDSEQKRAIDQATALLEELRDEMSKG